MMQAVEGKKRHAQVNAESVLTGFDISVLEVAGKQSAFGDWPMHNVWPNMGARTIYETDIDVEPSEEREEHYPGFDIYRRKLDVLSPVKGTQNQLFDFIHAVGLFGQPTVDLAKEQGKPRSEIEEKIVNNLDQSLRPGGFLVIGTRENVALGQQLFESKGYDIAAFTLHNAYIVAHKKGIYEQETGKD